MFKGNKTKNNAQRLFFHVILLTYHLLYILLASRLFCEGRVEIVQGKYSWEINRVSNERSTGKWSILINILLSFYLYSIFLSQRWQHLADNTHSKIPLNHFHWCPPNRQEYSGNTESGSNLTVLFYFPNFAFSLRIYAYLFY